MTDAERKLDQWARAQLADFRKLFGTNPSRWLQMVTEYGALGACKVILQPHPESWWVPILASMWETGYLDRSVEWIALQPGYTEAFTDAERAVARARFKELGWEPE
jgi:hypothetical protein